MKKLIRKLVGLFSDVSQHAPPWWHGRGKEVYIVWKYNEQECLTITSKSAHLKITKRKDGRFDVRWIIFESGETRVEGNKIFSNAELKSAFGLGSAVPPKADVGYAQTYHAEVAVPGKFIRTDGWLNIPCPGTGRDGDPNFSLYTFEAIRKKLEFFMEIGKVTL